MVLDRLVRFPVPVSDYLADDVAELPCVVVGRPLMEPAGPESIGDLLATVPLVVVGRPINNEDAQQELVSVTDQVLDRLIEVMSFDVTPEVVAIADRNYPAYLIHVSVPLKLC